MQLEFKNINPCLLLDKMVEQGLKEKNDIVRSDIEIGQSIANTVWVTCSEEKAEKIKEIAENLVGVLVPEQEENLIDKLILDNINMQIQIDALKQALLGGN